MTSKESYAAYEAIKNDKSASRWDKGYEEKLNEAIKNLIPEVGTKCTIIYFSDKRAATVSRIISQCKIAVKHNKVKCLDYYSGNYDILPEIDEQMGEDIFTKRRNGQWVEEGTSAKDGVKLAIHYQRHYIDPHF